MSEEGGAALPGLRRRSPGEAAERSTREGDASSAALLANRSNTAPIGLVVVGAHLTGQPLNHQLTSRGGRLAERVTTSADYALYLLATEPPKPGLVRVGAGGTSIAAELWELPPAGLASFLAQLPSPMALGKVRLADGTLRVGFLVEPIAVVGARDISGYGGWRNFLAEGPAAESG